ncbi:MAG: endonuclease III domain-containing protein [Candidatus Nitrosocaldus sp.]
MDIERVLGLMHFTMKRLEAEGSRGSKMRSRLTALRELQEEEGGDPLRILIGTILSARTRDENTRVAVRNLFSRFNDVKELADASVDEIEQLIRPAGFYRVKARRIKEVARIIAYEHDGRVPDTLEGLLRLPGVGRKTANCVLVYAFDKPAIPVDTHVHRIANRLGLVSSKSVEETEHMLMQNVDMAYWKMINDTFVMFGQNVCRPIAPLCSICMLKDICRYYMERNSQQ